MTTPPDGWASPDGWAAPGGSSAPPPPPAAPPVGAVPAPPPPPPPPSGATPAWGGYGPPPGWGAPVTPGVVPLRPLAVGELLDGAIKVVRRYPKPTLGLAALVALVTTVLNVVAVLVQDSTAFTADLQEGDGFGAGFSGSDPVLSIGSGLVGALGGLVLTGFLVSVVGKAVLGQEATLGDSWAQVRPRIWALLGVSLLVFLCWAGVLAAGVGLAFLLGAVSRPLLVLGIPLGIGGVVAAAWLYVRLSLAPAALVLERAGVRQAMRRSTLLVKGDWLRCFGILLLVAVITYVLSSVLSIPFAVLGVIGLLSGDDSSGRFFLIVIQVGSGLVSVVVSPFVAGARSLLYVDRRMRAEGLDLTLQAAARR